MSTTKTILNSNKQAVISAAILEAGRVANNKAAQMISKKIPIMARGYVETPFGKLAIANAALMAANQFRPENEILQRVTNGMVVAAYQELIQTVDIEGMLDDLISDKKVISSIEKIDRSEK